MRLGKDSKAKMLRRVPLFAKLSDRQLQHVAAMVDEIDLEDGRVLTREGDSGHEFFVILEGRIRIERGGKRVKVLGPGDFLGEIALIDAGPRTATATLEGDAKLLVLSRSQFYSLLNEFPDVQLKVLQALAARVRQIEPEITH